MPPNSQSSTTDALTEPDKRLLGRPPLEVVICEIRAVGDNDVALGPAEGLRLQAAAVAAGLKADRIDQTQQQGIRLQITPTTQSAPVIETRTVGWQLTANDGAIVTFLPGAVSIQTTRYRSWDQTFRPLVAGALAAFSDVVRPQVCQRVGLRYVDRLVDAGTKTAAGWRGRVVDSLLGPICDPVLGSHVVSSQQQVELSMADHRRALVRHGPFVDGAVHGAVSYILDIDVYSEASLAFNREEILSITDDLNNAALSLFQAAITPEYLAELRGK